MFSLAYGTSEPFLWEASLEVFCWVEFFVSSEQSKLILINSSIPVVTSYIHRKFTLPLHRWRLVTLLKNKNKKLVLFILKGGRGTPLNRCSLIYILKKKYGYCILDTTFSLIYYWHPSVWFLTSCTSLPTESPFSWHFSLQIKGPVLTPPHTHSSFCCACISSVLICILSCKNTVCSQEMLTSAGRDLEGVCTLDMNENSNRLAQNN